MTDERQGSSEEHVEGEPLAVLVERLALDLARAINAGGGSGRERLRDGAIRVLRDEVEEDEPETFPPSDASVLAAAGAQTSNPFAIAIPLSLVGGLMIILFPPVGLVLFAAAAVMVFWGLAVVVVGRSGRS